MISKGFCQVKINLKTREKLGSGWVAQALTRIIIFFGNFAFFLFFVVFFVVEHVSNFFLNG